MESPPSSCGLVVDMGHFHVNDLGSNHGVLKFWREI
jgi:hypothetical protein